MDVTHQILRWVEAQDITTGLLTVWCRHTSASLVVQENASPEVLADLEDFFQRVVPDGGGDLYRHDTEGPDDRRSRRASGSGIKPAWQSGSRLSASSTMPPQLC